MDFWGYHWWKGLPSKYKEGKVTSIFKTRNRNKCENYRGISGKIIYGKIIKCKLEENLKGQIGEE